MHGWRVLTAAAAAPADRLAEALADPVVCQAALLRSILQRNVATKFGQRHGFADIRDIDEYRAAVPVRQYDDFADAIAAIAEGETNSLTAEPVVAFERTGGTASGGKLIPYTVRALAGFRAAVLPWLSDMARRYPGVTAGSAYVSISPATRRPEATASGVPIGLETDAAYLGEDLASPFASLLAVSPETGRIGSIDAWRLSTLTQLVERDDLALVSVWSPTFFLALLESIPTLAGDLSGRICREANRRLHTALNGGGLDTTHLWPHLAVISCWTDAGSAVFSTRLARLCPQAVLQPKGLLSTEAAITLPFGDGPGCVPALTSCLVEFRDSSGTFRLAGELTDGETYDIILTTEGGLYRYDIGDRVRCVGKSGQRERLVFEGRAGTVSDLVGEKLDEAFVARVLAELATPAMLVARTEPDPHYELLVDGKPGPHFADQVETGLRANPQYDYARRVGQLGQLLVVADPGFVARQALSRAIGGQRLGDVKPVALRAAGF